MFKRVSSITLAVGLAVGLMGCSGGKKAEPATTQAASTQVEPAQEATKVPEIAKEAPGAEGEKKESEAQAAGDSGQTAPVKAPEDFPNKDITLVNPREAGDISDIPARIYADYISGIMNGTMMNVMDVTGSGGTVGAQQIMFSLGDGCTLPVVSAGYTMQYAKGSHEFAYEDFKSASLFVIFYSGMAVNASSGIETYEDLAQTAKDRPGEPKFGVVAGGLPTSCVLATEKQEDVDFNIVDIGGTTLKAPELLSNHIDVAIDLLAGLISYVDSGDSAIPGLYADSRLVNYPDVLTSAEPGYETNVMNQVSGIWAPKDTPDDVVEYLSSLFGAAAADEGVQKQFTDLAYPASYISTAEHVAYLEKMYADLQELAKGLN